MSWGEEIARFSSGGKTFFVNLKKARTGQVFININGMYSSGKQLEKINIFERHFEPLMEALEEARRKAHWELGGEFSVEELREADLDILLHEGWEPVGDEND